MDENLSLFIMSLESLQENIDVHHYKKIQNLSKER